MRGLRHLAAAMLCFLGAVGAREACVASTETDAKDALPSAIYRDPPDDPAYPASGGEQNLDLAQAMRRAGWTVITFHYRGAWGSGGRFTLPGGAADTQALLALLHVPTNAARWGIDAAHLVLLGHSYGGYIAARVANDTPDLLGVALLAPWDINADARAWRALTPQRRRAAGLANFDDVDGRLAGASALSLIDAVLSVGPQMDLTQLASPLAQRRVLVITATRDSPGAAVLRWLATLPGAPGASAPR